MTRTGRSPDGGARSRGLIARALLFLCALASPLPAWSQVDDDPYRPDGPLDVVVDSLPFVLERIWGFDSDRPFTVVLGADRVERTADGSAASNPFAELGAERHPQRWLSRQQGKAHVLGICGGSIDEPGGCRRGEAAMAAWLSQPLPWEGSSVVVEILLARRGGGPPARSGRFRAGVALTLEAHEGHWKVADLSLSWIT